MSGNPKASICIPSYNHARFLPETIESALAQTYRNIEIIIVDDGSQDESLSIAESYAAKYPTLVKVFTHPEHRNLGISATVNLGFEKATGDYYSGLPSDDLLYPDMIERQVEFLESQPNVGFVYSQMDVINEEGRFIDQRAIPDISQAANQLEQMVETNHIPGVTVLARRDEIAKAFPHERELVYSDWEFWTRLLTLCKVGFIDRSLVKYRIHSYNTSVGVKPEIHLQNSLAAVTTLRRKAPTLDDPKYQALLDLQLSHLLFCAGRKSAAAESLKSALATYPQLFEDTEFFAGWVERQEQQIYHLSSDQRADADFASWFFAQLLSVAKRSFIKSLQRQVKGRHAATAAFKSYGTDMRQARRMTIRCLRNDPRWIKNRMLMTILAETLLGPKLAGYLRYLKRQLSDSD